MFFFFCSYVLRRGYHDSKIEGLSDIEVLYSMNIYMVKLSCRLSRFLTQWSFRAKVFTGPGSKNVLSYYSYRTSRILIATGPQDPTANLTQSFWMAVAPPIFVANNN